jgi:hypothetical protein
MEATYLWPPWLSGSYHPRHALLEDPELQKMPLLVLGNKIDLEPHMSKEEIIKGLNLDYIQDQPWEPGLLTQGVPGVPHDPFAPRRGPLGSSPDRESSIGNAPALVPGPLARL